MNSRIKILKSYGFRKLPKKKNDYKRYDGEFSHKVLLLDNGEFCMMGYFGKELAEKELDFSDIYYYTRIVKCSNDSDFETFIRTFTQNLLKS